MHKFKIPATNIFKNISLFTFSRKICAIGPTTCSSVISMGNSFSTLFSYFDVFSMHKSKIAAIHIFDNIAFFLNFHFFHILSETDVYYRFSKCN